MRKRQVKKYGNSTAIKLESADLKDFELTEGDSVYIDEISKVKDE